MTTPRTEGIRRHNAILRKHKRNKDRRLRLPAAPVRGAIAAQTGRDDTGAQTT